MKIHCCRIVICVLVAVVLTGCASAPLSLWQEKAPARVALIEYVNAVTDRGSADFIPVERRIAVFDLDGTLFLETDPTYFDWLLFEHRVLEDPDYRATAEQIAAAKASRKGNSRNLTKTGNAWCRRLTAA